MKKLSMLVAAVIVFSATTFASVPAKKQTAEPVKTEAKETKEVKKAKKAAKHKKAKSVKKSK